LGTAQDDEGEAWQEIYRITNDPEEEGQKFPRTTALVETYRAAVDTMYERFDSPATIPEPIAETAAADLYYRLSAIEDKALDHMEAVELSGPLEADSAAAAEYRADAILALKMVREIYSVGKGIDYGTAMIPMYYVPEHQTQKWFETLAKAAHRAEAVCRRQCILLLATRAVCA